MQKEGLKLFYSLIIPVFNRPEEIETVLGCLAKQIYDHFEVIVVESGSTKTSESVVNGFKTQLEAHWFMYKNDGQGFSRNYGMTKAKGDYFVILDSDIIIDPDYLEKINNSLSTSYLDAFGGPDRFHPSFSSTQKAVDHVMTSLFTTGGIRGNKNHVGTFYPRSFNMGFSKEVYQKTNGFKWPFFGEDIELSKRMMSLGFKVGLIPEAFIYHKRKNSLNGHWKQMHFFGKARINIYKEFPETLKITHFFPAAFTLFFAFLFVSTVQMAFYPQLFNNDVNQLLNILRASGWVLLTAYLFLIFLSGVSKYRNLLVGLIAIPATFTQMIGYGSGFIKDFVKRVIFKKEYSFKNKD